MLHTSNNSIKSSQFQQDLLKFPPELRKLAAFIAQSDEFLSISEYAKRAGLSPNAVRVSIFRAKKRGNDFNKLLGTLCNEKLIGYKPQVTKVLLEKALEGSYKHLELYYRVLGELKQEKIDQTNNVNSLTFVVAMPDRLPLKTASEVSVIEADTVPNIEEITE
jgi:hypothetical protein